MTVLFVWLFVVSFVNLFLPGNSLGTLGCNINIFLNNFFILFIILNYSLSNYFVGNIGMTN